MPPFIPPTGLIGSEQALTQGLTGQLGAINQGVGGAANALSTGYGIARDDLNQGFNQASGAISPFMQGGAEASQLQAAQSGAMGPEAQAQAFQNYQESPGQQFLRDEAERALTRNAAATGGLGGGNVLRELQQQAIGLASQDFNNQFNRLGQVSASGQQAAGTQANIFGQQGASLANTAMSTGQNMGNLGMTGALTSAQAIGNTGQNLAQGRFATGQQIAQAAGNTSANMSNLQNQQGQQFSSVFGQGSTNLANLTSGAGQGSAQQQEQLAMILANLGVGAGSQQAQAIQSASQYDVAGILGQNTATVGALQQLLQLIPQGGGSSSPPPQNLGYGGYNPSQSGTQFSGTAGQMVS